MTTATNIKLNERTLNCLQHIKLPGDIHTHSGKIEYLATHYKKWQSTIALLESEILKYQSMVKASKYL